MHEPSLIYLIDLPVCVDRKVIEGLKPIAERNLSLSGATALTYLGWEVPLIHPLFMMVENMEEAVGRKLPHILLSLRHAMQSMDWGTPKLFDLDLCTNLPIDDLNITSLSEIGGENSQLGHNPDRLLLDYGYPRDISFRVSITNIGPDSPSYHKPPCTSIDKILIPLNSDLTLQINGKMMEDLVLEMEGLKELAKDPKSDRSKYIAIRFVTQTLLQRDGKRIEVNFGKDEKEKEMLFNWLKETFSKIIKTRDIITTVKDSYSTEPANFMDRFLFAVEPNWVLFDKDIQKIIIEAFNENY